MTADRVAEVWALLVNPEDGEGLVARLRVVVRPGGGEVRAPASSTIGPEVQESCRRAALLVLGAEQVRRTVDWELELEDGRTVELHGRSLTAAFAAALCAASAGVRAPEDVAITGDMDLSGALRPVGGLPTKARAAWARGMRVVAPAAGEEAAPSGGPIQLVADLPALRQALWPDAPRLATARTGGTERAARPRWRERWVWGMRVVASAVGVVWLWPRAPAPLVGPEASAASEALWGESPSGETGAFERSWLDPRQDESWSPPPPPPLIVCVLRNDAPLVGGVVYAGDELRLKVRAPALGRLAVQSISPAGDVLQVFPMEGEGDVVGGEQLVPQREHDALLVVPPAGEERFDVRWMPLIGDDSHQPTSLGRDADDNILHLIHMAGAPPIACAGLKNEDSCARNDYLLSASDNSGTCLLEDDPRLHQSIEKVPDLTVSMFRPAERSDPVDLNGGSGGYANGGRGRRQDLNSCVSARWLGQDEVVVTLRLTQVATPPPALATSMQAGQPLEVAP